MLHLVLNQVGLTHHVRWTYGENVLASHYAQEQQAWLLAPTHPAAGDFPVSRSSPTSVGRPP